MKTERGSGTVTLHAHWYHICIAYSEIIAGMHVRTAFVLIPKLLISCNDTGCTRLKRIIIVSNEILGAFRHELGEHPGLEWPK